MTRIDTHRPVTYTIEHALTRRERELLSALALASLSYNEGRAWTPELRALKERGLVFQSYNLISITDRGREVEERIS